MKIYLTSFSQPRVPLSLISWQGTLLLLFFMMSNPLAYAQEVPGNCASCFDGIDNNSNGLIDAADPACQNLAVTCPGFNLPSLCSPSGGTRADIISTQTRFRNAGGAAVTFTIPAGATNALVYISSHDGVTTFGASDIRTLADEDFITVNAVLNFVTGTSAGQLNYARDTNPADGSSGMTLFGWQNVAFGNLVSTGALSGHDITPLLNNVNFSVSGNTLTITESNAAIRSSYHVEFTSALTSSLSTNGFETRFLALGTAAANRNLSIPIPANTSIVAVSMKGTNGVSNNNSTGGTEEGFSLGRMLFDLDANTKNGYITVVNGGYLTYRSTYIVSNRAVDENANLTTVATGDFATKSTSAGGVGLYNPKMYISGGNLIIERDNDYAKDYEDTYIVEFFQRIAEPMSAEFLATQTLFVAKGVNINTPAVSDRIFDIPAGSNFIYFRLAGNSPNSVNIHNENAQAAYAVIDLQTETANGYYWQQVGFNNATDRRDDNFAFKGLPINGTNPKTHASTIGKQFGANYNIFFILSADKTKLTVRNNVFSSVETAHQIVMTADFYGSRPDLAIDPDEVSFNSANCSDIQVTLQMCNPGAGNSPQGMPVSFYVGNPTTDATAKRVHTGNFGAAVPVGGCASFTFSFPMGAYSNLNDIDLYMVVNDDGSFAPTLNVNIGTTFQLADLPTQNSSFRECDYANNMVNRRIQVSNCQVALPDFNVTLIETPTSGNVLTNDNSFGSNPLRVTVTTVNNVVFTPVSGVITFATANGSVTLNTTNGTYTYTPNAGFTGVDTFEYTACNNSNFCSSTTVTITVYQANPGNNPPVANNDVIDVFANTSTTGNLIHNDFDPDNDPLSNVTVIGDVPDGLVVNPNGTYTYTPPTNFVGILSFVYQVCDNASPQACSQATAVINVYPTTVGTDPPFAHDDANNGIQGTILSGNALLNDFDPNTPAQTLSVTPQVATVITGGTVSINAAGVYQFTPTNPAFVGTTFFTYQVCNTSALCDIATVYLVVQPAAPFAIDDINTVLAGQTVTGNVLTNDQNGVFLPVSSVIVGTTVTPVPASGTVSFTTANGGTVEIDADGNYIYTPSAASTLAGEDNFTYEICTPTPPTPAVCSQATVYIKVVQNQPFNQAPIAHNDIAQTIGSTPVTSNVLGNDSDPDGNPLTVTAQSISNSNGTFVLGTNGVFTFTPAAGITGTFVYPYQVCDNATPATCSIAEVTVIVYPAPNPLVAPTSYPPFAQDDAKIGLINVNITGNVLGNDTNPVGGTLTVTAINGSAAGIGSLVNLGATIGSVTLLANGNYTFVPATDFVGTVSFTYTVCNDSPTNAFCDVATVYLSAIPSNSIIANNDINNILQNTTATGSVATNDDTDGTLAYTGDATVTGVGVFTINPTTGLYTFVPDPSFTGTAAFPYTVCNQFGVCASAEVSINVFAPQNGNNPPLVHNDILETYQNITATGNVLSNDNELDFGQTLTVTEINGNTGGIGNPVVITGGTVTLNANGTYSFVPTLDFTGTTSFTYTACDNAMPTPACRTATVNITVYPATGAPNDPPFAQDDAKTGGINTLLAGNVLDNDFDPNVPVQALTVTPQTGVAIIGGTYSVNAAGGYSFVPNSGFTGTTSFTYQVCNVTPLCDLATVYLTVHPLAPALSADINNTLMNTPVTGNLLTNDSDPNGGTLTINTTPVSGPSNGTIQINADGTYTYTPNFGFQGTDPVIYEVCNTAGLCERTTLTITVQQQLPQLPVAQNNTPVANNDVGQTLAGVNLNGNVLGNDFDRDFGQVLTVNTVPIINVSNGTLTLNANGTYTYIPNAGFVGTDSFVYEVCDNQSPALCDQATVFITVYPASALANNPPFAQDDAAFVYQSITGPAIPVNGNVLSNDFDPNGGTLTVTAATTTIAGVGTFVIGTNGAYAFTPVVGYTGPANFTYEVCDNGTPVRCDVATVYITVQAASPLPPLARNDLANTLINTAVSGIKIINDVDVFSLRLVSNTSANTGPNNGTVTFLPDGTYTYTPSTGFTGTDEFDYEVCNSAGLCDIGTVKINIVNPQVGSNNAPVVQDDYAETLQNTSVNGNVLTNDFDYDGDVLAVTQINGSTYTSGGNIALANGILVMNSNGTFTFTPAPAFAGIQTFTYQVCDNGSPVICQTANVSITVYPAGSPSLPFAQNDAVVTYLSVPVTGSVVGNDSNGPFTSITQITGAGFGPNNGTLTFNTSNGAYEYTPNVGYTGADYFTYRICNANGCSQAMVSILTLNASGPLPISLLSFTASLLEDGKVQLDWATLSEQDNERFEVYRSADAQTWEMIGSKEGAGNSLTRLDYGMTDVSPLAGLNYYRLKQVDFDGTFTYSQAIAVNVAQIQWNVYPNPTARFVNIDLGKLEGKVSLQLFDSKGNLLKIVHLETRSHEIIQLDIEELSIAAYYLQISAGNNVLKRVLIKH